MANMKASQFVAELQKHVGKGYVYGGIGQICTIALLKDRYNMYGHLFAANYYRKVLPDGTVDWTGGVCGKWLGKWVADCSGLIRAVRRDNGFGNVSASAQGVYDQCPLDERGKIGAMPLVPGCAVFMWSSSKKRMGHVGVYIGDGEVVEAQGAGPGIVITKLTSRAWGYWGLLAWVDYDLPNEKTGVILDPGADPTQGDGVTTPKPDDLPLLYHKFPNMKGEKVMLLQSKLVERGYKMPKSTLKNGSMDGIFGSETDKVVRAFQKDKGLAVDGKVGILTWTKLLENAQDEPAEDPAKMPVLRLQTPYMSGPEVAKMQRLLRARGYGRDFIESGIGQFGPRTDRAVREFQRDNGLVVDGVCGPQTWGALLG